VPASTYEMYRTALAIRRELGLGAGSLEWVELGPDVVAFRNRGLLVVANIGTAAVALPPDVRIRHASGPLAGRDPRLVPVDTTVWAS
jgi:alpha-glucosidase